MHKTMRSVSKLLFAAVAILALVVAISCTSAPGTTTPGTTTTPSTTPPAPTITITSPSGGIIPQIGPVTVTVQVTNFQLVDKLGQANVAGQGHIHYFMDVDPPTTAGQPAVTAAGTYAATAATSYTWPNVSGGSHKFCVELVNNDHTPLVPPVTACTTVTVVPEIGPPTVVITAPKDGAALPAGNITVTIQTSNFNIVDKLGQANVSHEGHVHYFLDVDPPTTQGQPAVTAAGTYAAVAATSYTWNNVAAGTHKLCVELVNNDHTPLNPPVTACVTVTVQAATSTPPAAQTINLTAQNVAFSLSTITVPHGASITINFDNKDAGIPHNFALYQSGSCSSGTASGPIFTGQIVTGPGTATYTFTAPATPGNYFFRCDVHPTIMCGTFVVQ